MDQNPNYGPCLFLFDGYAERIEEPALSTFTGLLRDQTVRAKRGEFSLGLMIMALLRSGRETQKRTK